MKTKPSFIRITEPHLHGYRAAHPSGKSVEIIRECEGRWVIFVLDAHKVPFKQYMPSLSYRTARHLACAAWAAL